MSKFITSIKTTYTRLPVKSEKKTFVSSYSIKNTRTTIAGKNRGTGKKYANQLMK